MGTAGLNHGHAGRRWLARDIMAGASVALVLIPQALAYANVAGMPPVSGLYAAALPPLAAAMVASSPYLQTGPSAITCLLTFGALAERAAVGSDAYLELGIMLALMVGAIRVTIGLMRGGVIAHLMSEPMLLGFTPAAALLIVASQVPAALGAAATDDVLQGATRAISNPADWQAPALWLTAMTVVVVLGGRRLHVLFPGVLVALVAALLISGVVEYGGEIVGDIPAGVPPLPDLRFGAVPDLALPAVVIALLGFAEPASIGRTYATRERRRWSPDREFVSQGVANLASGVSGAFPVGGSISRSALNHMLGAATRLSGAVTGLAVMCFLPFAWLIEPLPTAVLAAIVMASVLQLIRIRPLATLWRISRPQCAVAWSTFALTLVLAPHVEQAVLIGIGLSLVVHLVREMTLRLEVSVAGTTLRVRPVGVLWFATAGDLQERLIALLESHSETQHLRLELDALGRVDLTGAMTLGHVLDDVRAAGVTVELHAIPRHAEGLLERHEAWRDGLR